MHNLLFLPDEVMLFSERADRGECGNLDTDCFLLLLLLLMGTRESLFLSGEFSSNIDS